MRKSVLGIFLAITMFASFMPAAVLAEDDIFAEAIEEDSYSQETGSEIETEGGIFADLFTSSDYQVTNIVLSEDSTNAEVTYATLEDCNLRFYVVDDDSLETIFESDVPVSKTDNTVTVDISSVNFPEYYKIYAVLEKDDSALSEAYIYYNGSKEYEEFMSVTPYDDEFSDRVVLDYGEGCNGVENFAVVKEDVKVVYVDSIDQVEIEHSDASDEENVELFAISEDDTVSYTFKNASTNEGLNEIETGDKVIILPQDDVNDAVTFIVGDIDDGITLFGLGDDEITLETDTEADYETEDFFDYIRINVEFEADTSDIDFSKGDEDLEVIEEIDEEVELFGTASGTKTASKSYTISKSITNGTIKDTVSVGLTVTLSINYSTLKLNSVTLTSTLSAKNVFTISVSKSASIDKDIKLGEIPMSSIKVVSFSIPVYVTLSASANAKVAFSATQNASVTMTAQYSGGSYSCSTTKSASSTKDLETEAKVSVKLGIKASIQAKISAVNFNATLTGEAGVKATGSLSKCGESSDGNSYHYCDVCLSGTMYVYAQPSFKIVFLGKTKVNKTWSEVTATLGKFYVSKRSSKWYYGSGSCTNWKYRVVVKTVDQNNNALSGVTVKVDGTNMGITNSNGRKDVALAAGTHTFLLSKSGYTSKKATKTLSSYTVLPTCKMTKTSGANETYYTIDDLIETTDEDYAEFMADSEGVANTIFQIQSAEDLQKLSDFVNNSGRDTSGLRFVLNNSTGTIDLSEADIEPIGTADNPFKGEFDGNKFEITGLSIDGNADFSGLFGYVSCAKIFDLGIIGAEVNGGSNTGILVGEADNGTEIYDCYVTGAVTGESNTGGMVGSLNQSSIINCYNTAKVIGGENTGGITGILYQTDKLGQISNVYNAGYTNGSGIAGTVKYVESDSSNDEDTDETEDIYVVGIQYGYYLDTCTGEAVGNADNETEIIAYSLTNAQATGEETETTITDDEGIANTYTLLDALNNWYNINGNNAAESEDSDEESEEESTELNDTDSNDSADSETVVTMSDSYNEWFADESLSNGGYPVFEEKSAVYALSVEYVYEDESEAKPTVILYLSEGQSYDVDSYVIDGYYTDDIEYSGIMPGYDLYYKVIYYKSVEYTGSASELNDAYVSDGTQASEGDIYTISSSEDIKALADYVNNGGNTEGVQFLQLEEIDMSEVSIAPIGNADIPFKGTYDGQYLTISNLSTNNSDDYSAFFGYLYGAEVKNITLDSISIDGNDYVGGIAGYANSSVIDFTSVSGTVTGNENVGGLVGAAVDSAIVNSSNSSSVEATTNVGGIVGNISSSEITNNYNNGNVGNLNSSNVGGIAGEVLSSVTIENNYNAGMVNGTINVGGVAGTAEEGLKYCYYLSGTASVAVGSGDAVDCSSFSDSDVNDSLYVSLNNWVKSRASAKYYTWGLTETYPIFAGSYSGWIMDIDLSDGIVSFTYNHDDYPGAIMYLAVYDGNGELLDLRTYTDSGTYSLDVEEAAATIKAFLWDEDMVPLENSISRTL